MSMGVANCTSVCLVRVKAVAQPFEAILHWMDTLSILFAYGHPCCTRQTFAEVAHKRRAALGDYKTGDNARQDIFNYIKMPYNRKCKYANSGLLSPVEYVGQQKLKKQDVLETRGIHWSTRISAY